MIQKKITEVIPRYASDSVYQIINERRVGDIKEFRFAEMRKGKKYSNAVVLTDKDNHWLAAADWFFGESVVRDEAAAKKIAKEYKRENIREKISKMEEGCPTKSFPRFFLKAIGPAIIYITILFILSICGLIQDQTWMSNMIFGAFLVAGMGIMFRMISLENDTKAFDWNTLNSLKALKDILDEAEGMTQSTNSIASGIMVS